MFRNTSIDQKHIDSIMNIDDKHINAIDPLNNSYLSSVLHMDPALLKRYNYWYSIDNKLYYFKDVLIFNELFLSELIEEYDLRTVKYNLAYACGGVGIISESIRDKNKEYYDYDTYFKRLGLKVPSSIYELDNSFKNNISEENRLKLMNEIYRLMSFDVFSGQFDRSEKNILFEKDSELHLATLFDYGSALDGYNGEYISSFDILSFPMNSNISYENMYLFELINKNYEFYKYLCKSLDIDINMILKRTIDKYKLCMPQSDQNELLKFFDNKKHIIENTLRLAKRYK